MDYSSTPTPPTWEKDDEVTNCGGCGREFNVLVRKHHCRVCGKIFCTRCCHVNVNLPPNFAYDAPQKCCFPCSRLFLKHALLIGDSHTSGAHGASFVNVLEEKFGSKVNFINTGMAGVTTFAVLKKMNEKLNDYYFKILDSRAPPDVIIIFLGTNNVVSTKNHTLKTINSSDVPQDWNFSFEPFSPEGFAANYQEILKLCQQRAPQAKIAVISVPPIGEDVGSQINQTVKQHNERLREAIDTNFPQISYLPLGEILWDLLTTHYSKEGQAPPPEAKLELLDMLWNTDKAFFSNHILGTSWQKLSEEKNLYIFHDHIHFNEVGAAEVSCILEIFLEKLWKTGNIDINEDDD